MARLFAVLLAAAALNAPKAWLGMGYLYNPAAGKSPAWLRVVGVMPHGPADRAGLRPQDVITAIDGKPLPFADSLGAIRFFASVRPRVQLRVHVRRGVGEFDVTLLPDRAPAGADKLLQQNLDLASRTSKPR